MLAHHVAVVTGVEDERVVGHAEFLQQRENAREVVVEHGDAAEDGAAGGAADVVRHEAMEPAVTAQPLHPLALALRVVLRHIGHWHVVVAVKVPVSLRGPVGVVWAGEGDAQEEGACLAGAGQAAQPVFGTEAYLLVVIHVARPAGSGLEDAVDVLSRVLGRAAAVGAGPVEGGGVDVLRPALLEAVELVRADEVHLAVQDGAVAGVAEAVGEGGPVAAQRGGVVPDLDGVVLTVGWP